jgi:hypothetical protein
MPKALGEGQETEDTLDQALPWAEMTLGPVSSFSVRGRGAKAGSWSGVVAGNICMKTQLLLEKGKTLGFLASGEKSRKQNGTPDSH